MLYYVYAYIRNKDSTTAKAGTPYYIGKGCGARAYDCCKNNRHGKNVYLPKTREHIVFLETNLTELGALALERRLIRWWGRQDIKSGILLNKTDGGDGASGAIRNETTRAKLRLAHLGKRKSAEARKNMSVAKKGTKQSTQTIEARAQKNTGKTRPLSAIAATTKALKGRKQTAKAVQNMTNAQRKHKYVLMTPENTIIETDDLLGVCRKYNLSYDTLLWRFQHNVTSAIIIDPANWRVKYPAQDKWKCVSMSLKIEP